VSSVKILRIKKKIILLPIVLYRRETLSHTLREERRWRVFENRVLRRIFGPKGEELVRSRRRLHNEELHQLYASPNVAVVIKSRRMRWVGVLHACET
jgi:transcription initiation factor IIE alpha subunit